MPDSIPVTDVFAFISKVISFPQPQMCKHLIAADLLSLLIKHGIEVSSDLAEAVVGADDETALRLLNDQSLFFSLAKK
jgi:hypothetical protein